MSFSCSSGVSISTVQTDADLAEAIRLCEQYAKWLDVDLAFQDFANEMASMPGKYGPPKGALLLARDGSGRSIGCVGIRCMGETRCCEMKRLYVASEGRGQGTGRQLAEAAIAEAKLKGYDAMLLDSLPRMASALNLYRSLGFEQVPPYYDTPLEGTVFLRLDLDS